jgi:hypothetical protein
MVQCGGGTRLGEDSGAVFTPLGKVGRAEFQSDAAFGTGIVREINDAHAAATELGLNPVLGNTGSNHDCLWESGLPAGIVRGAVWQVNSEGGNGRTRRERY